ncbi:MAG: sodium:solute symporter family transporter [Planctomycetota bacterium]|jgi:SSS family transporter
MKLLSCLILLGVFFCIFGGNVFAEDILKWSQLSELPVSPDVENKWGIAGSFVGVNNDALIIAGGVNISGQDLESEKLYNDNIHVLVKKVNKDKVSYHWISDFKLDKPMAYGSSVSTDSGVICIGGKDADRTYSDVFLLRWNKEKEEIEQHTLPPLPQPCAYSGAAVVVNDKEESGKVYVAGGITELNFETTLKNLWSLDLASMNDKGFKWEQVLPWPGHSRAFAIVTAQHNGIDDCVYVMSGRHKGEGGDIELLTDVYEFTPKLYNPEKFDIENGSYTGEKSPWKKRSEMPRGIVAGTSIPVGQSHIFIVSGDDGSQFHLKDMLKDGRSGFTKEAFSYHTITDRWINAGPIPANHLMTNAVRWGSDMVNDPIIISGIQINPQSLSPKVWQVMPVKSMGRFGFVDFSVIGLYLAAMVGVGVFFSFRNKNSDDYFRGGQRIPWFVAGLSIFATMLSSVTFVAIPAKAFATNWVYFMVNMTAIAITPLVILLFLPFFRKIDATSAYEYLEKRFNRLARLFASASFVLFQIGRMAVVMYLPALALAAITPMSEQQCILLMGLLSIIYCTMGGLQAVVWTDTIQSFVLLGGAFFSLVFIIIQIDGGIGGFMATASEHSKFHMVNWDFSSTSFITTALWVVVLGGIGQNLVPYASDMAVVQRYMSVPDMTRAKRAIWTNAVAILPASILFFGVGTALFVFYAHNPEKLDPTFKTDAIFPLFISRELPIGIAGLIVAGIFAAAQSTVSTSMNSTSTALVTDFIRPFNLIRTEKGFLRLGRVLTAVLGILGTLLALSFAASDIKSLWDQFMKILGLFGGPMCGLFCLGIFTTRTNGLGAIIGAVVAAIGLFLVQKLTHVHILLYASIGVALCFIFGYVASLVLPRSKKLIEGLTIYTLQRSEIS